MILIDSHSNTDLDQLSWVHYKEVVSPQNRNGAYHATQSLIGRINKQLRLDLLFPERVKFWCFFLGNHHRNLFRLITGRPEEISIIILEIEILIGHHLLSNTISYNQANLTPFGVIVKNVFGYENYRDNGSARENVDKFNLNYCPYCNIQKLERITNTDGLAGPVRFTALHQLDHFYPQSRYPYLAVSFFNLVPGCSTCNSHLKLDKDFNVLTHFNPFHKSFNDYFKFNLLDVVFNSSTDVSLNIQNIQVHPFNPIDDFRLIDRYNDLNTKQKVYNLFESLRNRSPLIRKSLKRQFVGLFGQFEITNEKLLISQGVPVEENQINNYEMGKMKRDICKQLGLI